MNPNAALHVDLLVGQATTLAEPAILGLIDAAVKLAVG